MQRVDGRRAPYAKCQTIGNVAIGTTVECYVVKYNMWAFPVHLSLCGAALLPNLMLGCSVVKAADCGGARCKGTPEATGTTLSCRASALPKD